MRALDFYQATAQAIPDTRRILSCPYHAHWIRLNSTYRTCPECNYCIRCKLLDRPVLFGHYHRNVL